uniref:Structural protein 1 n=1 Tax=Chipolycivirus sp. TaxID=2809300 RepID=A0AAU8JNT8_9VIRU
MSQTETNPLFNPTMKVTHPKQQQQVMIPRTIDFGIGIEAQTSTLNLNCNQMDWIKVSQKNKFIKSVVWNIDQVTPWFTQEINMSLILSLSQIGRDFQAYFSFDRVMISIQPTHQAFFQGNTKIAYDPSPDPNYYSVILGQGMTDAAFYQFQTVDFSPKSTQVYNFLCPMLTPFAFLAISGGGINVRTENYLNGYSMGRLVSYIYSPLTTNGANTSIQYNVSGQVLGLKTEAMKYP